MEFITYKTVQMNIYYTHYVLMMMGPTNDHAQAVNQVFEKANEFETQIADRYAI